MSIANKQLKNLNINYRKSMIGKFVKFESKSTTKVVEDSNK